MFNEKGNYQYPGDMVKSTYDSNNDGVVNAADTVPWSGVTNTPDSLSGYGIEEVPASVLSGVIGLEHIPPSAVERMKIVENDSMRFSLTTADVQNGDTVKVTSTNKMYLVVDDGNLDSESGYVVYEAGRAAAVDWTGVENKPETIENIDDILDTSEEESDEGNPITIVTDSAQIAKNTRLTFEPTQDLHGYDHPWPAGGGKNKVPMDVSNIKAINTRGTWSGDTYTFNGVTYTLQTDSDGNLTGVLVNGTATSTSFLVLSVANYLTAEELGLQLNTQYLLNGCVENGNVQFRYDSGGAWSYPIVTANTDVPFTFTSATDTYKPMLYVLGGNTIQNILVKPMIRLASESDATFAPYSNICPISGLDEVKVKRTGKNLLDPTLTSGTKAGLTAVRQSDKSYSLTGTATESAVNIWIAGQYITNPSTQLDVYKLYYLDAGTTITYKDCKLFFYDVETGQSNTNFGQTNVQIGSDARTLTVPHNAWLTGVRIPDAVNGDAYNTTLYPQIELGSTATDYEPYTEEVITESLPTTVYGGTLDLETGELVATHALVDLGALAWIMRTNNRKEAPLPVVGKSHGEKETPNVLCSIYKKDTYYNIATVGVDKTAGTYTDGAWVDICDSAYSDVTDFTNAMSGVQFVYELATPITYTLTPKQLALLKGTNHISANAKSVKVTFRAGQLATLEDVAGAVKIADEHLETALTPILGDFADIETSPAASNHAVGDYLIYDSKLYKVIAAITAGETLTEGTNIGRTTVAAELASLSATTIKFVSSVNETSGTVTGLINVIKSAMFSNGVYHITGTYTNHAYGYTAICWRVQYAGEPRYGGIVIAHDGYVYSFSAQGASEPVVKTITTP